MEIPQEGKYVCKLNGPMVIYEASTGSLCAAVPSVMVDSGFTFKHTMVLVKADGTIQTKTTDTLKSVFGWDGVDPFWLMDHSEDGGAMRAVEFEIVGGPETGDKGGQYFKSQWLNPLGGGMKTPQAAIAAAKKGLAAYMDREKVYANLADIARMLEIASKLGRLATGLGTDGDGRKADELPAMRVEVTVALEKIYGQAEPAPTGKIGDVEEVKKLEDKP